MCGGLPTEAVPNNALSGLAFSHAIRPVRVVCWRGILGQNQDRIVGEQSDRLEIVDDVVAQMRAGTIKAFAVTARSRLPSAPDIPTVDQAGLPGFYFASWFAFFAPKGTPKPIIDKLNAATVEALASREVVADRQSCRHQGRVMP